MSYKIYVLYLKLISKSPFSIYKSPTFHKEEKDVYVDYFYHYFLGSTNDNPFFSRLTL